MKNLFSPIDVRSNLEKKNPLLNKHLEGSSFFWKGSKIGVLFLHGLTTTTAEVRPLAKRFNEAGFTVSGVLLPGHGSTPEDLNKTNRKLWIEESEKAYLNLKSKCSVVYIAASSAGCLIALQLASKHRGIRGLILYTPALRLAISYIETFLLIFASPFVFSIKKKHDNRDGMPWQGYKVNPLKAGVELLKLQLETQKCLHKIYQPIFIFQASLDKTVDLKSGQMICKGVQSSVCKSYWMQKSHHVVILDREFEDVLRISLNFIKKTSR